MPPGSSTPRSLKRKRTVPIILPNEDEEDLAPTPAPGPLPDAPMEHESMVELEGKEGEEELSPEEEERLKAWDNFSEEYHDSALTRVGEAGRAS
jgi:hypothetical protein